LEKKPFKQGQVKFERGRPRPHARRRARRCASRTDPRRGPLGPHAEASPWSVGPCVSPGTSMPPPCSPSPRAPCVPTAAGLRRGRPPVPLPPQVSTQIEPMRTLDHFPPLTRPSPPPVSPESGRTRRPCPLGPYCKAPSSSREFSAN
jgi:hypothetical protein